MTTPVDISNRALAEIGTRSQLTGSVIDATQGAEALYCSLLYGPLRDFMLREGDYDWAMLQTGAVTAGGALVPWAFSYLYPAGALRIRQMFPILYNPSDPRPVEWNVIDLVGVRKIMTLEAMATILYTGVPPEDLWDPIFTEAFVRLLGSGLAFALENRIEASQMKLNEAISFAGIANLRDS